MKKMIVSVMNVCVVIGLGWAGVASAEQYFTNLGGPLPWDGVTANWAATSSGPYDSVWTGGDAVFEGVAGTANVDTVTADSLTFSVAGYTLFSGTLTLTGPTVIANSGATITTAIAGSAGLTKGGTDGTLTLGGINTYSGGTTINAGTLAINADNQLGAAGEGLTLAGGTLRVNPGLNTITRPLTLGSGGGTFNLGTYLNYNGPITGGAGLASIGSDIILSPPSANDIGTFTLTGSRLFVNNANAIANNATLAITGNGRLIFQSGSAPTAPTNSITFTSGCGVSIRTSALADLTLSTTNAVFPTAGSFVFNRDDQPTRGVIVNGDWPTLTGGLTFQVGGDNVAVGAVTLNGALSGAGGITKTSSGTLVLAVSNSFSSGVSVSAGSVRLGNDSALGVPSATLTVLNGGTLDLAGHSPRVSGLTDTLGLGVLSTGVVTNSGAEATLSIIRASKGFGGTITGPIKLVIPTGGSGYQVLSGNNSYTGLTTVYGSLEVWGANALGSTAVGTVITNGAGLSMKGIVDPIIYATEPLIFYGSSSFSLNTGDKLRNPTWTGPLTLASGATVSVAGGNTNCTITIPSSISGTGALKKETSAMTLMLSGANDYSGGTTLTTGTLKLGSVTALGTGPVTLNGGLLDLNGMSATIGSLGGSTAAAIVDTSSGSGTITLTVNQSANTTCSTPISNGVSKTVALTLVGTGVLTLNATNTFTGATTVNGGALKLGMLAALPSGITVNSGGTLDINALDIQSIVPTLLIAGPGSAGQSGALANTGGGTEARVQNLTLTDDATIGNTGSKLNVYGTLDGGGHVLTVAGTGETNIRNGNNMINLAGVTVNSGLLRLESSQSWPGTYTVNAGARLDSYGNRTEAGSVVINGGQLANGGGGTGIWTGAITLTGTSVVDTAGGNMVLSNAVAGTGALTKVGANTLTLAGACSFADALSVSNGTVTLNGSLAHANITVTNGATLNGTGTIHSRIIGNVADKILVTGTLDVTTLTLDLDVTAPLGDGPYTLVDATGGTLVGRFAVVTGLPSGYALSYQGQEVLLIASGTIIILR